MTLCHADYAEPTTMRASPKSSPISRFIRFASAGEAPAVEIAIASGPVRTLDAASTAQLVADLSRVYEGPAGLGDFEQSPVYSQLLGGITGFELTVAACVGKFKLSQNRTPADRASVIAELAQDAHSEVRETAAMMRALDGL